MKKYLAKKLKCDIRVRISVRQPNDEFKDELRIDLTPITIRKIYIKYRGKDEITTLTDLCKRGIEHIRLIMHKYSYLYN